LLKREFAIRKGKRTRETPLEKRKIIRREGEEKIRRNTSTTSNKLNTKRKTRKGGNKSKHQKPNTEIKVLKMTVK